MKVTRDLKFETSAPPRLEKEIPLSKFQLYFPRRLLKRQLALSSILLAIPLVAFRLDIDAVHKWFALGFSIVTIVFLLFMLGAISEKDQETLSPEKYYGRGTLIGIGIFWLALILISAVVLYIQFPRP
jgi:hypothetical protein